MDKNYEDLLTKVLTILDQLHKMSVTYLKIFGFFFIFIGLTYVYFQSPSRIAGLAWLDFLTLPMVGGAWIISGIIVLISAFFGTHKIKRLGFFLLILVPTALGFYFLIGTVAYLIPWTEAVGYRRAGITTVSYWAYAAASYFMSKIHSMTYSPSVCIGGVKHGVSSR